MQPTRIDKNRVFLMTGLAGLFAMMTAYIMSGAGSLVKDTILSLAQKITQDHGIKADPKMIAAMIQIESSGNPSAVRYEPNLRDVSVGLMQTLGSTARWLASDMGYTAYGVPTNEDLMNPEISIYFGAAYIEWLSTYKGKRRTIKWIVESYNGGPGNSNAQTLAHFEKYKKARRAV